MSESGPGADFREIVGKCRDCLARDKPVRIDLPGGGRLHVDRKLPFVLIHVFDPAAPKPLAHDVTSSNASYALLANDPALADFHRDLLATMRETLCETFGAFFTIELTEAERSGDLRKDAPILPDYDVAVHVGTGSYASRVADRIKVALESAEIYYRTPRVTLHAEADLALFPGLELGLVEPRGWLGMVLPPVYHVPGSDDIYPELFELLVTSVLDALLQGLQEFSQCATPLKPAHHRALGRRAFIRAIRAVDRKLDDVARSFDFLLAITPINSGEAWLEFRDGGFAAEPKFRYRPLAISTDDAKRRLYALPLDHLEDPALKKLFREKQHEVDHQLTLLQCRNTRKFKDASRLLYGGVEPALEKAARSLLAATGEKTSFQSGGTVGWPELKREAERTFRRYRHRYAGFDATVEIRDDIPPGLMVSGPHLLISSSTAMAKARVDALLQHE
ncbi:MAG: tyrosine/phenylalanine carboxypeptidase domain-containing protein, partial [Parvibaculaceae bacterium]